MGHDAHVKHPADLVQVADVVLLPVLVLLLRVGKRVLVGVESEAHPGKVATPHALQGVVAPQRVGSVEAHQQPLLVELQPQTALPGHAASQPLAGGMVQAGHDVAAPHHVLAQSARSDLLKHAAIVPVGKQHRARAVQEHAPLNLPTVGLGTKLRPSIVSILLHCLRFLIR